MLNKAVYYYDSEIATYYYTLYHPMRPLRTEMTNTLLDAYGLLDKLFIIDAESCKYTKFDFTSFHTDEYIDFLKNVTPNNYMEFTDQLTRFNIGPDCPVFDGLYDYCDLITRGTVGCAAFLNSGYTKIAINWSGGLHHAKNNHASGFCYVNDIVIGILELLKCYQRVLYIDIDIHHGDGVEEAFYTSNRVLTCSFHKYGNFFPGSGALNDIGIDDGKYYSVNIPLHEGMNDDSYVELFKVVINALMENYKPEVIVLQCGADSIAGDRLGCFNLSVRGHGACVEHVRDFNVPLLVLGGGGYTLRNVARLWTYETALLLDEKIPNKIPPNEYFEYYAPEYRIHMNIGRMDNKNTEKYLELIRLTVLDNIKHVIPVAVFNESLATFANSPADDKTSVASFPEEWRE